MEWVFYIYIIGLVVSIILAENGLFKFMDEALLPLNKWVFIFLWPVYLLIYTLIFLGIPIVAIGVSVFEQIPYLECVNDMYKELLECH